MLPAAEPAVLRPTQRLRARARTAARVPTVRIVRALSRQGADSSGSLFHFSPGSDARLARASAAGQGLSQADRAIAPHRVEASVVEAAYGPASGARTYERLFDAFLRNRSSSTSKTNAGASCRRLG
jgi:hypothetical protein